MNIFTRKKALLARIDDLESQIQVQSRELANEKTKSGNLKFDLNNMTHEFNNAQSRIEQLHKNEAALQSARIQETKELKTIIKNQSEQIAELHDTTSGLASSVSDLKAKLKAKSAKVTQLTRKIEELKGKDKPKTTKQ